MNSSIQIYLEQLNQCGDKFYIGPSSIHGNGLFAKVPFSRGDFLFHALKPDDNGFFIPEKNGKFEVTLPGSMINHSNTPNAETRFEDGMYNTYAINNIIPGSEIMVDYTKNKELEQPRPEWK